MTFCNAFGLSLYAATAETRSKAPSSDPSPASHGDELRVQIREDNESAVDTTPKPVEEHKPAADPERPSLPVTLPGPDWPQIRPLAEAERLNEERQVRIDKSVFARSESRRERNPGHRAFVASKPCLICGRNRSHAHHLKFAQPAAFVRKVSDEFTVPLCSVHHRELHRQGDERVWWEGYKIDTLAIAKELWNDRRNPAAEICRHCADAPAKNASKYYPYYLQTSTHDAGL